MLDNIIRYSINNKIAIFLFVIGIAGMGIYSVMNIPIGAVPDVTNNQVQVITTSRNLAAEEVERFLTYPVELGMSNLPGVREIRSISKFGLSVVTIVFDDQMDSYLPRQLIAERLKAVADEIPEGFGTPFMGPISTGLGEIYQYVLEVDPEYAGQYSVTELRSIQDWIVKRYLSGIPGVIEINTWGGLLKTYEVQIRPNQLRALDISLQQIYLALKDNNSIAGGGYIEKSNQAYFIRADGLLKNVAAIEDIVVTVKGGIPIYIKDVGSVQIGSATRFGAITGNGEGEKVMGQIMMLKGANAGKVIQMVKERVAEIEATLPQGVRINPILERSELIGRTTMTIAENLLFGFLIVFVVVVFLLGDFRAGLVVASIIPLTLLFALTCMYFFGVDANLMSLGAIDFGIIIDGAVIIVEYIAYKITFEQNRLNALLPGQKRNAIDRLSVQGASKMMRSAIFGQVIIIIVFIPILSLSGIEGKMFRPMALTFCFALIGAIILCLTYVPVMSSLFIRPRPEGNRTMSDRFIDALKRNYSAFLPHAIRLRYFIIIGAAGLLMFSALLFNRMGGEFVPTLDEGDFAIQPVLPTGMSLSATIDMMTRMEKILLKFPEVDQIATRIGAAEVPTDPMSMEESDIIVTLHDDHTWTSARTKDELADTFKEALAAEIPGIEMEFTQPIEMRFNELITGVRADLAIKVYGENLDFLNRTAQDIEELIRGVEGAADISVEKTAGLPQMSVVYDRKKMARYGINANALNDVISIGFAGKKAGVILEGARQFDLVLRYDQSSRQSLDDLKNSLVDLPGGQKLPLSEFADITYQKGPAKISRDNTNRRVVVGVNVRGRDLQSVVDDIQSRITNAIDLPPGYYIAYGGQFENLQAAQARLRLAVPIALILIFILLYFAFHSVREALLIYSAIPLAVIGGIFALYLRDMPFSISAGVGFIALFGIAVLNGIVLIEHFNELKSSGMNDIKERVLIGTRDRIRPVLLTATAAALGFLPMAVSTSAGAEVQRPLATVVIGGLITATLLTLLLLPLLYLIVEGRNPKLKGSIPAIILLFVLFICPDSAYSQQIYSPDEVVAITMSNNWNLQRQQKAIQQATILTGATKKNNFTDFYYEFDRANQGPDGKVLHTIGASHSFHPPALNTARAQEQMAVVKLEEVHYSLLQFQLKGHVLRLIDEIHFFEAKKEILDELILINMDLLDLTSKKITLGEGNTLELLQAQEALDEYLLADQAALAKINQNYHNLKIIMSIPDDFQILPEGAYTKKVIADTLHGPHPQESVQMAQTELAKSASNTSYSERLPVFRLGLFNGMSFSDNIKLYPAFQIGIGMPLSKEYYNKRKEAAAIKIERLNNDFTQFQQYVSLKTAQLDDYLDNLERRLQLYETNIQFTLDQLESGSRKAVAEGEMGQIDYLYTLEHTQKLRIKYVELIHEYNQSNILKHYIIMDK